MNTAQIDNEPGSITIQATFQQRRTVHWQWRRLRGRASHKSMLTQTR